MKATERNKLATIIVKIQTLKSQISDPDERRKLHRAESILMTIIHPGFTPPGLEDDEDSL